MLRGRYSNQLSLVLEVTAQPLCHKTSDQYRTELIMQMTLNRFSAVATVAVVTVVAGDVASVVVAAVVVAVAVVHNQSHERNFFFPFLPKNNFNEMLIDGVCQMSKISQNKSKNRNFILIHSIG